ncbi:hypothetical protein NP284_25325 [Rhodopseudomonas pseudopalustris]|uniref:hypothetical protein n=1 Tax=Rhodopseudomonas pseudopalustris TaxID=1513892 RepID=UPI003F9C78E6
MASGKPETAARQRVIHQHTHTPASLSAGDDAAFVPNRAARLMSCAVAPVAGAACIAVPASAVSLGCATKPLQRLQLWRERTTFRTLLPVS